MRHRERRHVQRLADVARSFRSAAVLVQEGPAARKVQQRCASKQRHGFVKRVTVEREAWAHVLTRHVFRHLHVTVFA